MLFVFPILFLVLCLYRIRINNGGYYSDYISKDKTDSIKGIFILIIFFTHSMSYMTEYGYNRFGDSLFLLFGCLSQLVVVMFLFYSGYGVGESFKKKGQDYVRKIPKHRVLGTLLNFDIAVCAFIVLCLLLGVSLTTQQCLLSLTGWESVGNSNWYIFVILLCYSMTFVALSLPIKNPTTQFLVLFGLCLLCLIILSYSKDGYWYSTILSYPFGFLYSVHHKTIETFLKRYYWQAGVAFLVLFLVLQLSSSLSEICDLNLRFNAMSILFAFVVVMLTMRVSIDNAALRWFGKNLFPMYIYMRLPMMFIENKYPEMILTTPALFVTVSFLVTITIAYFYRYWQIKL